MRTTLTLDEDVAAKLRDESRRTGKSFKQTVNEFLRLGLNARKGQKPLEPFKVKSKRMGLRPGLSYDCVGALLEAAEGPGYK